MRIAAVRYGCILCALVLIGTGFQGARAAGQQEHPTTKRARPQLTKPHAAPTRKAAKKKPRRSRAARPVKRTVLEIDSCVAERFTGEQAALRAQIERWLDVRYRTGGLSARGVDCSGFLLRVYGDAIGMELPRTAREQATAGARIDAAELAFGDLVFFRTRLKSKAISHVGIYLGDGRFVHASRHRGVTIDRLASAYYARRFMMARRVLPEPAGTGDLTG